MEYIKGALMDEKGDEIAAFGSIIEAPFDQSRNITIMHEKGIFLRQPKPTYSLFADFIAIPGQNPNWSKGRNCTLTAEDNDGKQATYTHVHVLMVNSERENEKNQRVISIELCARHKAQEEAHVR